MMYICIFGERAKRARHSQVCSIENRDNSSVNLPIIAVFLSILGIAPAPLPSTTKLHCIW